MKIDRMFSFAKFIDMPVCAIFRSAENNKNTRSPKRRRSTWSTLEGQLWSIIIVLLLSIINPRSFLMCWLRRGPKALLKTDSVRGVLGCSQPPRPEDNNSVLTRCLVWLVALEETIVGSIPIAIIDGGEERRR